MSELIDMTEDEYLSSPLVNRLRWKYACGKVGVCSDRLIAADEIDRLRAEVEKYKAIASKAIREQIDVRKDERERCAKIALDTYSDQDRMKYTHDTYTSGFSDCKLKIHRAIMEASNDA